MLNRRERQWIDDEVAKQTVNSWCFHEIDSEIAKPKVNAKLIIEIGNELIVISRTTW